MAYNKTTWKTGDIITAVKLNNIENGIETIDETVYSILAAPIAFPDYANKIDVVTADQYITATQTTIVYVAIVQVGTVLPVTLTISPDGVTEYSWDLVFSYGSATDVTTRMYVPFIVPKGWKFKLSRIFQSIKSFYMPMINSI